MNGRASVGAEAGEAAGAEEIHPLRRLLLVVILVGSAGLIAELFLLEHTENVWQWLPLIVLGSSFVTALLLLLRPSRALARIFQLLMALALLIGALGFYLHYTGNSEFELEMDSTLSGFQLVWNALRGATPALAPGALAQIGLLGLVSLYRHPLLRRPAA